MYTKHDFSDDDIAHARGVRNLTRVGAWRERP